MFSLKHREKISWQDFYLTVSSHTNLLVSHVKWLVLLDVDSQIDERQKTNGGVTSSVKREMVAQILLYSGACVQN